MSDWVGPVLGCVGGGIVGGVAGGLLTGGPGALPGAAKGCAVGTLLLAPAGCKDEEKGSADAGPTLDDYLQEERRYNDRCKPLAEELARRGCGFAERANCFVEQSIPEWDEGDAVETLRSYNGENEEGAESCHMTCQCSVVVGAEAFTCVASVVGQRPTETNDGGAEAEVESLPIIEGYRISITNESYPESTQEAECRLEEEYGGPEITGESESEAEAESEPIESEAESESESESESEAEWDI